jgi:hypothetical protein
LKGPRDGHKGNQKRPDYYTVQDIAKLLNISGQTMGRLFGNMDVVLDISEHSFEKKKKYRYRTLRIPAAVLARFLHERRVK